MQVSYFCLTLCNLIFKNILKTNSKQVLLSSLCVEIELVARDTAGARAISSLGKPP